MKTLVVYFSNSGNTRSVAEALGARLKADIEGVHERKPRPLLRMPQEGEKPRGSAVMKAAMGGMFGFSSRIEDAQHDPAAYDLVIVGTPLWAGGLTPAVRSYLKKYRKHIRQVAFFCTGESPEKGRALRQMEKVTRRTPVAIMSVPAEEIRSGQAGVRISGFADKVASA